MAPISGKPVWRWLHEDAIRPWQHRCWIFPHDPDFAAKAGRILDLYARRWEGKPLEPGDFVLSTDEKTSIQARIRCHPTLPVRRGSAARVEHEYARGGAWAYSGRSGRPSRQNLLVAEKPLPALHPSIASLPRS